MIGEITTTAHYPDGTVEVIEDGRNLVVNSAYTAFAQAAKEGTPIFVYWALGDGDTDSTAGWNTGVENGSIAPEPTNTKLRRELYRKAILPEDIEYIDSLGNPVSEPNNRVQVTVWFDEDEPYSDRSAFLREWGIFGGGGAAEVQDSGLLINHRFHTVYEKTPSVRLKRVIRFTF